MRESSRPSFVLYRSLSAALATALISACAAGQYNATPGTTGLPQAKRATVSFSVLHNFQGGASDGQSPQGVTIGPDRVLFGTTHDGGHIHPRDCAASGCGAVYENQGTGTQLIHRFQPQPQGFHPVAGLLLHNGVYYGAAQGGKYDDGIVFSIRRNASGDWVESALYEFKGAPDGSEVAGVSYIDASGTLYGTTRMGGTGRACLYEQNGCGTVFALQPPKTKGGSWSESVLHSFQGSPSDGASPTAFLVRKGSSFFGTTEIGGASGRCPYSTGCGAIYKITPHGSRSSESLVYSFGVSQTTNDGVRPATLVDGGDGKLYGITANGGGSGKCTIEVRAPRGCGTAYSFPFKYGKKSHDTILYAFAGLPDGMDPDSLTGNASSGFYGLTYYGGSGVCDTQFGCGTVFSIVRSGSAWAKTTLHVFTGGDGKYPYGPMSLDGRQLFGTAWFGGTAYCPCGTLYALTL